MRIDRIDHFVLTVADVEATIAWYERVLGMEPVTFSEGRRGLAFGSQKINLHQAGSEYVPHATPPTPGSADYCLISAVGLDEVAAHLQAEGVPVELGPVPKQGAQGSMTSLYVRDPDANLVELSVYD